MGRFSGWGEGVRRKKGGGEGAVGNITHVRLGQMTDLHLVVDSRSFREDLYGLHDLYGLGHE